MAGLCTENGHRKGTTKSIVFQGGWIKVRQTKEKMERSGGTGCEYQKYVDNRCTEWYMMEISW